MKKTIVGILAMMICTLSFGQSFEGKLTYKVEFDIKPQKIENFEKLVIEKMKEEGAYFDRVTITLKGGDYIKEDNSTTEKRIIYKSDVNKIYNFQNDFDHVMITDANKRNALDLQFKEPKIEEIDSLKVINGHDCRLVKLSWDKLGEEYYYYNAEVAKLDAELFKEHNYEYFNTVVGITNSYPLEIVKTLSNFVSLKMTLVSVSEEKIEDALFELPKFKKAKKDYAELMLSMTGCEVMKIKK